MKIYLDTNLVIAVVEDDQPGESGALTQILELRKGGLVEVVTSRLTKTELERWVPKPGEEHKKVLHLRIYDLLMDVPSVETDELKGFNTQFGEYGGWSSPRMDPRPDFQSLVGFGLKPVDAHHVLHAIDSHCNIFLTCDRGILNRCEKIKTAFPCIEVSTPKKIISRLLDQTGLP